MDPNSLDSLDKTYLTVGGIVTALIVAIAQTLVFTRFAKDIERPMWKMAPGFASFFRYCSFWFTLNYINIAAMLFIFILSISDDAKFSLDLLRNVYQIYLIPFGATVMFYGNTSRHEMGKALSTMLLQFPRFLLVGLIVLIAYTFLQSLQQSLDPMASPLIRIIEAYIDCFIFAYVWEICRFNREEEENSDDMEF